MLLTIALLLLATGCTEPESIIAVQDEEENNTNASHVAERGTLLIIRSGKPGNVLLGMQN